MSDTSKAVLLIADISGFTGLMRHKVISMNHAKQIVVRLLKALIGSSKPPLRVAELEGDAVFFYALCNSKNANEVMENVKAQIGKFFHTFQCELESLETLRTCTCEACENAVSLKLKQVVHFGDIALETIDRFEKLFGLDVIVVHRMLKNTVQKKEYVMMTEPVYARMDGFYGLSPEQRKETFEGVGDIDTLVFYTEGLINHSHHSHAPIDKPSILDKFIWRLELSYKFVFDFLRFHKVQ